MGRRHSAERYNAATAAAAATAAEAEVAAAAADVCRSVASVKKFSVLNTFGHFRTF